MHLTNGSKVCRFTVVEVIGQGGMGEVYKAQDSELGRTAAIKVLRDTLLCNAEFERRLEREARAISTLEYEQPETKRRCRDAERVWDFSISSEFGVVFDDLFSVQPVLTAASADDKFVVIEIGRRNQAVQCSQPLSPPAHGSRLPRIIR
jgi:serine/threonine protein kinase